MMAYNQPLSQSIHLGSVLLFPSKKKEWFHRKIWLKLWVSNCGMVQIHQKSWWNNKHYQVTAKCCLCLHCSLVFSQLPRNWCFGLNNTLVLQILLASPVTWQIGIFSLPINWNSSIFVGFNKHRLRDHWRIFRKCTLLPSWVSIVICSLLKKYDWSSGKGEGINKICIKPTIWIKKKGNCMEMHQFARF